MAIPEPPAQSTISKSEASPASPLSPPVRNRGITARAILFALALMPINAYWITIMEVRWYTLDGSCLPLFISPVYFLFWITFINRIVRRILPNLAFDQGELLCIYVMLVIATALAGHDLTQNLFGTIGSAYRFATPENKWKTLFFPYLDHQLFLIVHNKTALKGFYQGGVSPWHREYAGPFIGPLMWWAAFLGVLVGVCLCLNILIRNVWTAHEKLAFPIIQLPMAMTSPETSHHPFWRNKLMWGGFALAAVIDIINGIYVLNPQVPNLPVKFYNVMSFLTTRPWSAVGSVDIRVYPFAVGLAYFMPLDLSFSCWFFFVSRLLFQVLGAYFGWDAPSNVGFPFFQQQSSGAFIALGFVVIWSLKGQLKSAWRTAFGSLADAPEPAERQRYRGAFAGLVAGFVFLTYFCWRIGMTPWVSLLFFGIYFLFAITITRVRAEFGTPHEIYFVNPRTVLVTIFGSSTLGGQNLTALSTMYWFNRGYRNHPMPNQLEAFKMGENGRMQTNRLIGVLLLSTFAGMLATDWANLQVTFNSGATSKALGFKSWVGFEAYGQLGTWLQSSVKPNATQWGYLIGGALMVIFLRVMRGAFLWWPFHPAGYALAVSYAMDYFWFAVFVSWLLKLLIVRFGGMRAYNAAIPFFLGLILGDYVTGALWAIYGPINHVICYKIYI